MCPFKKELQEGKMVCDAQFYSLPKGVGECPTQIFNQCQSDEGVNISSLEIIRLESLKIIDKDTKEVLYEQKFD